MKGIFPETMVQDVLEALDATAVLHNIDYRTEMIQDTGAQIKCFCPIHKETIFRTLVVDKKERSYRCSNFSCAGAVGGDLVDLFARATGYGYEQALLELAGSFGIAVDMDSAGSYVQHTLEVARNYLEMGVLKEAEEQFVRILSFQPACREAMVGLTRLYEMTDRAEEFQAMRLRLARTLVDLGENAQAIELLKIYTRDNPHDVDARVLYTDLLGAGDQAEFAASEYVRMAAELAEAGEIDRALALYRKAGSLGAEGFDISGSVVRLLTDSGRREEAIAERLNAAAALRALGDGEGAFAEIEAAADLDAAREDLVIELAELQAAGTLNNETLARLCDRIERLIATRAHGPAGRALMLLEPAYGDRARVMALRAELEDSRDNREQALDMRLKTIDLHTQRREFAEALNVLDRAMASGRNDNVALLSRRAMLLRELGRDREALEAYVDIVDLFRGADEYEHAAAVYQTIIDLEPDEIMHREAQFDLYLKLGMEPIIVQKALGLVQAYRSRNELDRATTLLYRALDHAPVSPELLIAQGEIFETLGRKGEAAEQFRTVGAILLETGKLDRARQMLDRALKCVPEHLEAREGLADVLTRQEMTLQAMGIYTDLVEFYSREKDHQAVIRVGTKILGIQSEHLPTLLMLTQAHRDAGEQERMLATQTRLVQIYLQGESYTRATELCEEILTSRQDYTPALEQLVAIAEATSRATQSVKYLWRLSQIHARAGRREVEQGLLRQILIKDPLHEEAWLRQLELMMQWGTPEALQAATGLLCEHFERNGRAADALRILQEASQTPTPKAEIFRGIARLAAGLGQVELRRSALRTQAELLGKILRDTEAIEAWGELAALSPEDLNLHRIRIELMLRNGMQREVVEEYRTLAHALTERREYDPAEIALTELLIHAPNDREASEELIALLVKTRQFKRASQQIEETAARHVEERRYPEAIQTYEGIFEFAPERDDIMRKIIAIRQRMGDFDGALAAYDRLLDCYEQKEAWIEFEQTALEALTLKPQNWALHERVAAFYQFVGRQPDAEASLLNLAVAQIEANALELADRTLNKLLELNPDSVSARAHRAEIMARQGNTAKALSEFMHLTGALGKVPNTPAGATAAGSEGVPFLRGNYEGIQLIHGYTFDNFIVGARNNFAHATALAVSRSPAKAYNPLFLYSDVGLGKTHLCHAIAHYIVSHFPELKVLYTTTEDFVAQLIEAIQSNGMAAFRNRHKLTDILLIDDVQFLSGKERAQEEFFHIFNANFQAGKQIVLTSDRPPKDIAHLEKRLKSRFGAGIIVDIQSPDIETRVAILRNELEGRGKPGALSAPVLQFIAERIITNVRDLKGALNQVLARHEHAGGEVDLELTRQVLAQNYTED